MVLSQSQLLGTPMFWGSLGKSPSRSGLAVGVCLVGQVPPLAAGGSSPRGGGFGSSGFPLSHAWQGPLGAPPESRHLSRPGIFDFFCAQGSLLLELGGDPLETLWGAGDRSPPCSVFLAAFY